MNKVTKKNARMKKNNNNKNCITKKMKNFREKKIQIKNDKKLIKKTYVYFIL